MILYRILTKSDGEVAERSNAAVLKTVDGLNRPGVRIPPSPPESSSFSKKQIKKYLQTTNP